MRKINMYRRFLSSSMGYSPLSLFRVFVSGFLKALSCSVYYYITNNTFKGFKKDVSFLCYFSISRAVYRHSIKRLPSFPFLVFRSFRKVFCFVRFFFLSRLFLSRLSFWCILYVVICGLLGRVYSYSSFK